MTSICDDEYEILYHISRLPSDLFKDSSDRVLKFFGVWKDWMLGLEKISTDIFDESVRVFTFDIVSVQAY